MRKLVLKIHEIMNMLYFKISVLFLMRGKVVRLFVFCFLFVSFVDFCLFLILLFVFVLFCFFVFVCFVDFC